MRPPGAKFGSFVALLISLGRRDNCKRVSRWNWLIKKMILPKECRYFENYLPWYLKLLVYRDEKFPPRYESRVHCCEIRLFWFQKAKCELINTIGAWDKQKIWVRERNRSLDFPNTWRELYPLSGRHEVQGYWSARQAMCQGISDPNSSGEEKQGGHKLATAADWIRNSFLRNKPWFLENHSFEFHEIYHENTLGHIK